MGATTMNDIMFQIHDMIKSNPDILKLIYYDDNDGDILNDNDKYPNLTLPQAQKVFKENIYTRKKIPKETDTISCYISMEYGQKAYHHQKNQFYNGNTFFFYILCHSDFDTNEIIGSRICEIEDRIAKMFDGGEIGAVCKTYVNRSVNIGTGDYIGRQLEISFFDINKSGD